MMKERLVDLNKAFFHGLSGLEVNFVMYPKDALYLSMVNLNSILQHKGIYSREKISELLKRYKCEQLPITDINGNQLVAPFQEIEEER